MSAPRLTTGDALWFALALLDVWKPQAWILTSDRSVLGCIRTDNRGSCFVARGRVYDPSKWYNDSVDLRQLWPSDITGYFDAEPFWPHPKNRDDMIKRVRFYLDMLGSPPCPKDEPQ